MDKNIITEAEATERLNEMCKLILSCFRYGRANAIHLSDLRRYSGLDDRRLRKIIELIRRSGICVCADNGGYYFPETAEELERYIKRVEKSAKSLFFTLKTAKTELAKINGAGQTVINGFDGEVGNNVET